MSENAQEKDSQDGSAGGDEQEDAFTPEDLQPGEDNPLAEPLDDDEARDDLDVLGGKTPAESEDSDGSEGSDEDSSAT